MAKGLCNYRLVLMGVVISPVSMLLRNEERSSDRSTGIVSL